jgi:opacity protein-like surface antigen
MKVRFFFAGLLLAVMSAPAAAQFSSGLAYHHLDADDFSLGGIVGSIGYRFELNDAVSLIPEVRGGIGVVDDEFMGADVELDGVFGGVLRLEFQLNDAVYLQLSPSYARYKASISSSFVDISESDEEFGIGGGIGFRFNPNFSAEVAYESVDDLDVYLVGLRFDY